MIILLNWYIEYITIKKQVSRDDYNFDVLVGDFMTFSAAICADQLKIPFIIN